VNPFITVENCRFLNVPAAQAVIDEVFKEDCYRLGEVPPGSIVLDVGAFYGEVGIYLAKEKGCRVFAYEPCRDSFEIAWANAELNDYDQVGEDFDHDYRIFEDAVAGNEQRFGVRYFPHHPAGSVISQCGGNKLPALLSAEIKRAIAWHGSDLPVVVKLDCEGSEASIFRDDPNWMDGVSMVMMEWHNHDGHIYKAALEAKGFKVELEGNGPKPRPPYDPSFTGGLLFARR